MTPTRHLHAIIAVIHAAIGQAYIGFSYLADDETRIIGKLHLRDAATALRQCADRLEKLGESEENEPTQTDISSSIAAAILRKSLKEGKSIKIPSLDIEIAPPDEGESEEK